MTNSHDLISDIFVTQEKTPLSGLSLMARANQPRKHGVVVSLQATGIDILLPRFGYEVVSSQKLARVEFVNHYF